MLPRLRSTLFIVVGVIALTGCKGVKQSGKHKDGEGLWRIHSAQCPSPSSHPSRYVCMDLDTSLFFQILADTSDKDILLPNENGHLDWFEFKTSGSVHPKLAKKYPGLLTFKAKKKGAPHISARFEWTEKGFSGYVTGGESPLVIEPYPNRQTLVYCYRKKDTDRTNPLSEPNKE